MRRDEPARNGRPKLRLPSPAVLGIVLAAVLTIGSATLLWFRIIRFVPYVPVERRVFRGDHLLCPTPTLDTPQHRAAIVSVLRRYNEPCRVTADGRVWIRARLAGDPDLLANYTTKARNVQQQT